MRVERVVRAGIAETEIVIRTESLSNYSPPFWGGVGGEALNTEINLHSEIWFRSPSHLQSAICSIIRHIVNHSVYEESQLHPLAEILCNLQIEEHIEWYLLAEPDRVAVFVY